MAIVSNCPFTLQFNDNPVTNFTLEESEIYDSSFEPFTICENEKISILFKSSNEEDKLYLDALDIIPDGHGVMLDEFGKVYRYPSSEPKILYDPTSNEFDALRVDTFKIVIVCNKKEYFSLLEVRPKQLNEAEWRMMKNDLEYEISGLAQDIVRRNIGIGTRENGNIPPEKLYCFFVIKKYATKVLGALTQLQKAPRFHILTEYVEQENFKAAHIDGVTVRKYLRRGGSDSFYDVPVKRVTYDIQENRLLKKIIHIYDRNLQQFIDSIFKVIAFRNNHFWNEHKQFTEVYDQSLQDFLDTANKLKTITGIIKTQQWYKTVSETVDLCVPHSFAMDSRYGVLYKMFEELQQKHFKIQLDPNYSYSWKKSSSLYEMWCYIKICRAFSQQYQIVGGFWDLTYGDEMLFPYLTSGTKMSFSNEMITVDIIFDQFVPKSPQKTQLHKNPFYTVGLHCRPDITIDIYQNSSGWYIGSIILECKYRKLSSFWWTKGNGSSREQIKAYYTDNKSHYTYGSWGETLDIRPIQEVMVLTPDVVGSGQGDTGTNTTINVMKPDGTNYLIEKVMQKIENAIKRRLDSSNEIMISPRQ